MKKTRFFTVLLIAVFALVSCSEYTSSQPGKVYIVSAGMSGFTGEPCEKDSNDFSDCMMGIYSSRGIETTSTVLKNPTSSELIGAVNSYVPKQEDLFILFYSGHGNKNSETCWLETKDSRTTVTDLVELIEEKKCRCVVIIDACKIGAQYCNGEGGKLFESLFNELDFSKVSFLAGSLATQSSYTGGDRGHSVFTGQLLRALGYDSNIGFDASTAPVKMTVRQLFNRTVQLGNEVLAWSMPGCVQTPDINFNEIDTVLIPRV